MENTMKKKIDELNDKKYKDPYSLDTQIILHELHKKSLERQEKMKKMIEDWKEEDRNNEIK